MTVCRYGEVNVFLLTFCYSNQEIFILPINKEKWMYVKTNSNKVVIYNRFLFIMYTL